jgi:hypothetical protein
VFIGGRGRSVYSLKQKQNFPAERRQARTYFTLGVTNLCLNTFYPTYIPIFAPARRSPSNIIIYGGFFEYREAKTFGRLFFDRFPARRPQCKFNECEKKQQQHAVLRAATQKARKELIKTCGRGINQI